MTIDNDAKLEAARETFHKIVGARLTSVQFVMDYLILGFDQKGALTTLVWPDFLDNGTQVSYGQPSYRDNLCSLIECPVTNADFAQDETITIGFDDGIELRIPLQSYGPTGERAIFTAPGGYLHVF